MAHGRPRSRTVAAIGHGARSRPRAITVHEREAFTQIERRNDAYRGAVDLMARIERLAATAGEPERFHGLLGRVRTKHKAKRNLGARPGRKRWP